MEALRRLYAGLRLRVNETKSAVAPVWRRKFLGYSFWVAKGGEVRMRVAPKALEAMKDRVRRITSRNGGRSLKSVTTELRSYLTGWKEYFQMADTPKVFQGLDEWVRHRLRAVYLKQWKRPATIYRELRAREVPERRARGVAAHACRWWRMSANEGLHIAFPTRHFDEMGVPRLAT